MKREFIELPEFLKQWNKLGFSDSDLCELEIYLCRYPSSGDLIQGTGGLRKLRWKIKNKGKKGGVRILYIDFVYFEKIYLVTLYPKSKKTNISDIEKKEIKTLIKTLKSQLERK